MPQPVQLTHILAEPIYPPKLDEAEFDAQVQEHHALVTGWRPSWGNYGELIVNIASFWG